MNQNHSLYLSSCFDREDQAKSLEFCKEILKEIEFDSFVVRGISGVSFGSVLAYVLGKKLAVVRKPHESSHGTVIENLTQGDRVIFLDDIICTGETLQAVLNQLDKAEREVWGGPYNKNKVKIDYELVGGLLYMDRQFFSSKELKRMVDKG